jgi:hypothetical protein
MLAPFTAIGLLLPGMQFGFLALGAVLVALGPASARLARAVGPGLGPASTPVLRLRDKPWRGGAARQGWMTPRAGGHELMRTRR